MRLKLIKLLFIISNTYVLKKPGLVFIGGESCSEGCGFESQNYLWCRLIHIYLLQKLFALNAENKQKEAGFGPFKKRSLRNERLLASL